VSAALDGGTEVCVFLLTFAVDGGSGIARRSRLGGEIMRIMLIGVCTTLLIIEGRRWWYSADGERIIKYSSRLLIFAGHLTWRGTPAINIW
jgi:hypothetical protein